VARCSGCFEWTVKRGAKKNKKQAKTKKRAAKKSGELKTL
jgi:hypothetical protein